MVDIRSKQLKIKWYYKKGIKFGKILLHFTINIYIILHLNNFKRKA